MIFDPEMPNMLLYAISKAECRNTENSLREIDIGNISLLRETPVTTIIMYFRKVSMKNSF